MSSSDETLDALFDGRLSLYQSRAGYRFSLDALLLAHFVTVKRAARIVDLGTGNGVIPLILADLHPLVHVTGIEVQPPMVERARRNIELNRLGKRIEIVRGDVRNFKSIRGSETFDGAVCNPPYRKSTSGRLSANPERQLARHELAGTLEDFLGAGAYLMRSKGSLAVIYPAVRGADLLTAMRRMQIEPKRLQTVHSFAGSEATLLLVEGVKGSRSGLKVLAPLTIYRNGKQYSDEIASMIAGAARNP